MTNVSLTEFSVQLSSDCFCQSDSLKLPTCFASHFIQWQVVSRIVLGSRGSLSCFPSATDDLPSSTFCGTSKRRLFLRYEKEMMAFCSRSSKVTGGRSMSTELEREKKKLPRSDRIIRSLSFESSKRALS